MSTERGKERRRSWRRWLTGAVLSGAAIAVASGFAALLGVGASAGEPKIPREASLAAWSENGEGGRHLLQLADGNAAVQGPAIGIVMSDTQCEPDAQGFSHCRNDIALANGIRITVIDTHDISRHPCLEPGERLSLRRIAPAWLEAVSM